MAWTRHELDAAYNNGAAVADSQDYRARWQAASDAVRAVPQSRLDLRYGAGRARRSTIFRAGRSRRRCSCSSTAATGSATRRSASPSSRKARCPHGINVALPGYTLGPEARLSDIVAEYARR